MTLCLLSLFGPSFRIEADGDGRIQVFNHDGSTVDLPTESDNMITLELTFEEAIALYNGRDYTPTNDRNWVRARGKLREAVNDTSVGIMRCEDCGHAWPMAKLGWSRCVCTAPGCDVEHGNPWEGASRDYPTEPVK